MPPTDRRLSGTIRNPDSGEPVAGARVTVEAVDDRGGATLAPTDDAVIAGRSSTTTDTAGAFAMMIAPSSERTWQYAVTITLPGRPPHTVNVNMPDRDATLAELLPA